MLLILLLLYICWWTYRYRLRTASPPAIIVHAGSSTSSESIQAKVQIEEHALLIQQKKVRPKGDLGSILTRYAAEADQEEYVFNATFSSANATDNDAVFTIVRINVHGEFFSLFFNDTSQNSKKKQCICQTKKS